MRNFSYTRAANPQQEALTLIATMPNAKFLGGGTNLVDLMRENIEQPDALVDVTRLDSADKRRLKASRKNYSTIRTRISPKFLFFRGQRWRHGEVRLGD